ncbi:10523_t:CDS:2 [Ambispora leptoticha]|uniref:10523_t:CDS:1 n=1 Tax=Ambispora leptoticha TaxID=144679 RepID=A0A9N9C3W7_9GLOM|nr:10523_t:CDS:2 [Ambispora leptoticha]
MGLLSIVFSILAFHYERDLCRMLTKQQDIEECMKVYIQTVLSTTIFLGISTLFQVHFCLAIWTYYQKLRIEHDRIVPDARYSYAPPNLANVIPPPTYGSIPVPVTIIGLPSSTDLEASLGIPGRYHHKLRIEGMD